LLLALAGKNALPAGSTVTFANMHTKEGSLDAAVAAAAAAGSAEAVSGLSMSHIRLDPLQRAQLARLDLQAVK